MLTAQELDVLATHLTPRLVRGLFETGHFSNGEVNDFNKITSLTFMSPYKGGIVQYLASGPDAEQIWGRLTAKIPADTRFSAKDRFIRHLRLKDMLAFCALQTDPLAMAMLQSLPKEIASKVSDLLINFAKLGDQEKYYPLYLDIIKAMAKLTPKDTEGDTPLMYAAMKGNLTLAKSLLVAGAGCSINDKGHCLTNPSSSARADVLSACEGYTALELAIKYKHLEMQALFLDYGADINIKHSTFHPVNMAIAQGDKAVVDLLLSRGADLSVKNMKKETPLLFSFRVKDKKPEGSAIHEAVKAKSNTPWIPTVPGYSIAPVLTGLIVALLIGIIVSIPPTMWVLFVTASIPVATMALHKMRMKM